MGVVDMDWRHELSDLLDAIAYGVLYAPDEFPDEDYLGPSDQMTFEKFTDVLRDRLQKLHPYIASISDATRCDGILEDAISLYSLGQRNEGAWKLQELEEILRSV